MVNTSLNTITIPEKTSAFQHLDIVRDPRDGARPIGFLS